MQSIGRTCLRGRLQDVVTGALGSTGLALWTREVWTMQIADGVASMLSLVTENVGGCYRYGCGCDGQGRGRGRGRGRIAESQENRKSLAAGQISRLSPHAATFPSCFLPCSLAPAQAQALPAFAHLCSSGSSRPFLLQGKEGPRLQGSNRRPRHLMDGSHTAHSERDSPTQREGRSVLHAFLKPTQRFIVRWLLWGTYSNEMDPFFKIRMEAQDRPKLDVQRPKICRLFCIADLLRKCFCHLQE